MIYLASPYSDPDPAVQVERYEKVSQLTAALLLLGHQVFSPIAYSHPLAVKFGLRGDFSFWKKIDLAFLARCEEFWLYELPGFEESLGVRDELDFACSRYFEDNPRILRRVSESEAEHLVKAAEHCK